MTENIKVKEWKNITLEDRDNYEVMCELKTKYASVLTTEELEGEYATDYKRISNRVYKIKCDSDKLKAKTAKIQEKLEAEEDANKKKDVAEVARLQKLKDDGEANGWGVERDEMNERWCLENIVFLPNEYYVISDSETFTNKQKMQDFYGERRLIEIDDEGKASTKYVIDRIKDNPEKMTASGFAWMPVANDSVDSRTIVMEGKTYINEYTPIITNPVEGDVSMWIELVEFICGDYANLFLDHMAFTAQHPEKKIIWQILVYDAVKRNGKSAMTAPLSDYFGNKAASVSPKLLESGWGDVYAKHKVITIEELRDIDNKSFNDIKTKFANVDTETLNLKGGGFLRQANRYSIYLYSNRDDVVQMDIDEGKLLVIEGPGKFIYNEKLEGKSVEFYEKYWDWTRTEDGKNAIAYHLLNRDVSDFKYNTPPPVTAALEALCQNSAAAYVKQIHQMIEDNVEPFDKVSISAEDLYDNMRGAYGAKSLKGIWKALRDEGFVPVKGQKWYDGKNNTERYWALKDDIEGLGAKDLYDLYDKPATNLSPKNIKVYTNQKLLDLMGD